MKFKRGQAAAMLCQIAVAIAFYFRVSQLI